jgi:hypothetical protein
MEDRKPSEQSRKERMCWWIVSGIVILLFFFPIRYLLSYATFSYPLEYREGASLVAANSIQQGVNPYSVDAFPEDMYVYGFLYPLMISPWISRITPQILIPRWIDLAFLCLTSFVLMAFFRWKKASFPTSLMGILIFLNAMCLVFKINGSRADIPAQFFCLLAIYLVLTKPGSFWRVLLASLSGLCCLLIKQYFIIPVGLLAVYIFFFQSKRNGAAFLGVLAVTLITAYIPIRLFLPLYFRYTILHHIVISTKDLNHLLPQLGLFFTWFGGLSILLLWSIAAAYFRERKIGRFGWKINIRDWNKPFLEGTTVDYFDWGFLCILLILALSLGQNPGNSHTYFLDLALPYLIISVISFLAQDHHTISLRLAALALALTCILPLGGAYQTNFTQYAQAYRQLENRMDQCRSIYGAPILTPYLLAHGADTIYDNGQSEYGSTIIVSQNALFQKILGGHDGQLENKLHLWNQALEEKIINQDFDCIAIDSRILKIGTIALEDYYISETQIPDVLDWDVVTYTIRYDITVWVPKE